MKVAFYSNFLNHHQLPLCLSFSNMDRVDFTFVATEEIPQERLLMNYADMNEKYPFVLRTYEGDDIKKEAYQLSLEADVVIIGSAPNTYLDDRLNNTNKLTFRFCERSLRKGVWRRFVPRTRKRIYNDYLQHSDKNLYILGASAYTAHDIVLCGFPQNKCYKWGYFPEVERIKDNEFVLNNKRPMSIVWVGRFIKCKHPEHVLKIAEELLRRGYNFNIKMIGDGVLKERIIRLAQKRELMDVIEFVGALTPDDVREEMRKSEIFLFTSDFYEGWGAVVNEAMNSFCVPVVSHACGSAAFLIKQGMNGYVYSYHDYRMAADEIGKIFDDSSLRKKIAVSAYNTMVTEWNADNAAKRLIELCESLMHSSKAPAESGPCSKAPILDKNWLKKQKI